MLARIFAVVVGLALGGTLSQGPEFVQQYTQRLGGRLDELSRFVRQFDEDASRFGLARVQALEEFQKPGSAFINRRGLDAQAMIARHERYVAHKAELEQARPFGRLVEFARDFEPDVVEATFTDFEPGIPVTTEGAVLGGGGFLAGLLLAGSLWGLVRAPRRRRMPEAGARES